MKKNRNFWASFRHALTGVQRAAARERNFRIQIFIAIAAVVLCIVFQVDSWHFLGVVLSIFFVLAMELVNTAVEAVVDLTTKNTPHPLAKIAKDAAAGAVLLASFSAVIVGLLTVLSVVRRHL